MSRTFQRAFTIDDLEALRVARFTEDHVAGEPALVTVEAVFEAAIDIEELVGREARLVYGYEGDARRVFSGHVESVEVIAQPHIALDQATFRYVFEVGGALSFLQRDFGCTIFQDKSIPDVIKGMLDAAGVPADRFELRLTADYAKRDFCVRYQETALDFIRRWCEREGIYFFSSMGDDGTEKVIFADDSPSAEAIEGGAIALRARSGQHDASDAVFAVHERRAVGSGTFTLRDFDFEKPALDLTAQGKAKEHLDLEAYDYPGGYFEPAQGKRIAAVRLESEEAASHVLTLEADTARIAIGHLMKLEGARDDDGEYFVFATRTEFVGAAVDGEASVGRGGLGALTGQQADHSDDFRVRADVVPKAMKYRLPIVAEWPAIAGPQTAVVMAPSGAPAEEIHTDKHGRAKLKFHWDLADTIDDKASAWFRVEQLQTSGSMMLPRVGWEVMVDFLEGDPDRPIVGSRIYNGMIMPPYALPEGKTRTAMRTASTPGGGGSNEIRFEDKAGAEEIMINSQYDTKFLVAHNKKKTVGNNETQVIKNKSSLKVGGKQAVKITKGSKTEIKADQTVTVSGNRSVEVNAVTGLNVTGSSMTHVSGNLMSMVGSPLEGLLSLVAAKAAELATAKAGEALAAVNGAMQSKVNQVMGPVKALTDKADALGKGMQALHGGDMAALGGVLGAAGALPSASAFGAAAFGGGPAAGRAAPGTSSSAGAISAENALGGAVQNAMQRGLAAGSLAAAVGLDGKDGGGQSGANVGGPAGDVGAVDETDRAKGPGHTLYKITGTHTEKVATIKALAALNGINTNVTGAMNQTIGAAKVEMVLKDYAESVEGEKSEMCLGLIVATKGDESEHVKGGKKCMVGGAVVDSCKGSRMIQAGAPATFVGAFHKLEAKDSITLKCGASEVVIDSSGVTIKSAMISITAAKIEIPKAVTEL